MHRLGRRREVKDSISNRNTLDSRSCGRSILSFLMRGGSRGRNISGFTHIRLAAALDHTSIPHILYHSASCSITVLSMFHTVVSTISNSFQKRVQMSKKGRRVMRYSRYLVVTVRNTF